jgi:hypothetical protein
MKPEFITAECCNTCKYNGVDHNISQGGHTYVPFDRCAKHEYDFTDSDYTDMVKCKYWEEDKGR